MVHDIQIGDYRIGMLDKVSIHRSVELLACRNSRKSRRFCPPGEMRPISAEASRG